ncbi:protocatechuate 3,4-dioxygenase subunit alpha [Pseudaestuariivita sp.]|uniref:protocatechuate 3,4-dioxygenase subunit alpha n=1 Tax=Pseudaestuariivita sp. TaxID=2211669 RepID=UPI0040582CAD
MRLFETASQTAGPYVHIGLTPHVAGIETRIKAFGQEMIRPEAQGARITLEGRILDGAGAPVSDGLIEFCQADAEGRLANDPQADHGVLGWARRACDAEGRFRLETVMPGTTADGQAPHLAVWIVARGINIGLHSRVYLTPPEVSDPLLDAVPPARRQTLIAQQDGDIWCHDIRLQEGADGAPETVFFDI